MKIIFALLLLFMALPCQASSHGEGGVLLWSYHLDRDKGYNEENYGVFGTYVHRKRDNWDSLLTAGLYKDSYGELAAFVMAGPRYRAGPHLRFGLNVGHSTAYDDAPIIVVPTVAAQYDRLSVGVLLLSAPIDPDDSTAFATYLTWSFD